MSKIKRLLKVLRLPQQSEIFSFFFQYTQKVML